MAYCNLPIDTGLPGFRQYKQKLFAQGSIYFSCVLMPSLQAVFPLKISGSCGHDDLQRAKLLLRSLSRYLHPDTFRSICIVSPKCELHQISTEFESWKDELKLEYYAEEELIPGFAEPGLAIEGWRRQMMIKLAFAASSSSEFVLTLDADVVCKKNIGYSDLIYDGKAMIQVHARQSVPNFSYWFVASGALLNIPAALDRPAMSVTPAILSREISAQLLKFIENRYGKIWWHYLMAIANSWRKRWYPLKARLNWSEYSLYYMFAEHSRMLWSYHLASGDANLPGALLSDKSFWFDTDCTTEAARLAFSPEDKAFFFVYQSRIGYTPERVMAEIGKLCLPEL